MSLRDYSDEKLQECIQAAQDTLSASQRLLVAAQEKVQIEYQNYMQLVEEHARRKVTNTNIDYAFILEAFPESQITYNKLTEVLNSYNLRTVGYWPQTGQRAIQVSFNRRDCESNKKQIEGVRTLLPFIKGIVDPRSSVNNCKFIDILEHTYSEHASYKLAVRPNDTVVLITNRYGHTQYDEIGDFDSAMKYVQEYHYCADG